MSFNHVARLLVAGGGVPVVIGPGLSTRRNPGHEPHPQKRTCGHRSRFVLVVVCFVVGVVVAVVVVVVGVVAVVVAVVVVVVVDLLIVFEAVSKTMHSKYTTPLNR